MYIKKKHMDRRTLLKGTLGAIGLPLLDAMIPAFASSVKFPQRFMGIFIPHGAAPGYWVPEGSTLDKLPFLYQDFAPVKNKTIITSGIWCESSENPPGVTGADHFVAASYFAGVKPMKTTGRGICGVTVDQVIAKKYGQENLLPSIEISLEDPGSGSSNCGEGYTCVYTNTISWRDPLSPNPMELNPEVLYARMFGHGTDKIQQLQNRAKDQSILDSVLADSRTLQNKLSATDKTRLDEHLENIREIERRIGIAINKSDQLPEMDKPYGIPSNWGDHFNIMTDMLVLAFSADITRVSTMLMARDLTGRIYPESGTNTGFHSGSHHGENPDLIRDLAQINRYHNSMVANLAIKLDNIKEGENTLLDNTLMVYGSNMGNSNQHLHFDTPMILVGGAGKNLKGNRHIAYKTKTVNTTDIMLDTLRLFDINPGDTLYGQERFDGISFGDSSGLSTGVI
jgi:hypothetical protein